MYKNRLSCWAGVFSAWLVVSGASLASAAQTNKNFNSQITGMQKKVDALQAEIQKQNDQIVYLQGIAKQPAELKARLESPQISPLQSVEQFAPLVSAGIALTAALIAALAYWANRRSSSNTHMHGVFRDYLKLRFDYHMKVQEKNENQQKLLTETHVDQAGEKLPEQLGGIELYALEEMFLWINSWAIKLRAALFPSQRDVREAWENTIKLHVLLYPEDVEANLLRFPECFGIKFLEFVKPILNRPEVNKIVDDHRAAYRAGRNRSTLNANSYYLGRNPPAAPVSSGSASKGAGSNTASNSKAPLLGEKVVDGLHQTSS